MAARILRTSNPGLYHSLLLFGAVNTALGANLFLTTPTFNPYGIPKDFIGAIFTILGAGQLIALGYHDLRLVRKVSAVSVGFMFFWGLTNTQQVFAGKASLQLPILYIALALLQILRLTESPVNPMTERK